MRFKIFAGITVVFILGAGLVSVNAQTVSKDTVTTISSNFEALQSLPEVISDIKSPELTNPEWLQAELDAETAAAALASQQASRATLGGNGVVTYDVTTSGTIIADLAEFKSQANQTLNDSRGWARLGVSFQEVASGGNFTLVLSEASQVDSFTGFSGACSADWSCRVGRYVIINQDRWLGASDAWTQAGGFLRDYRNMVISHETGHWLGHGHLSCGGAGQAAPLMQQQSIDLQGCSFNPWPLNSELWSSQLGV